MADNLPKVLVTGASGGIGAMYADRFARRGHDLVLVARDGAKMAALAERLRAETGVAIEVLPADLTDLASLRDIEAQLRGDARIGILVNNAGGNLPGGFATPDVEAIDQLIRLNVTSVARLTAIAAPLFVARGGGSIINITSVMAFGPEISAGVYSATKAFVLGLSQSLHAELGGKGLYVQAVLPAATRTDIWEKSGRKIENVPGMMEVDTLVDAALVGFDRRELITIPPLPDEGQWKDYDAARRAMLANVLQAQPAARYRV